MEQVMQHDDGAIRICGYLPFFLVDTDFLHNGKMLMLSRVQRHDFFAILSLKRAGWLDRPYPGMQALDALVAKMIGIGKKACERLKAKLLSLEMIAEDWQPRGWNAWQSGQGHKRHNARAVRDIVQAREAQQDRREQGALQKQQAQQANRERVQRWCQKQQQGATEAITGVTPRITEGVTRITSGVTHGACNVADFHANKGDFADVMVYSPLHIQEQEQEQKQGQDSEQNRVCVWKRGWRGKNHPRLRSRHSLLLRGLRPRPPRTRG